jgi:hypothetical protein
MKKAIGIIIFGLLLSSNAFAAIAPGMFGTKYILHEFTGQERGLIHLRPARKTLEGTLEFRYISKMFEGHLMQHGFKNTSDESKAQYIGLINYGLVTDGVYSTTYDMKIDNKIGHSIISEASEYLLMPPKRKIFSKGKYIRVMELNIYDLKKDRKVQHIYKGKIVSKGKCGEIQSISKELISMMFKKWPGKNGTKKVWVPIFIKSC